MSKIIINTLSAPKAIGPYSQAVKAGGMIFVSGQIPINPSTGEVVSDTIETETVQVLENIKAVLKATDAEMADIVKTTIFLADMNDFTNVNEVYGRYFPIDPPARATVQAAGLPKGVRVEIEAIAVDRTAE